MHDPAHGGGSANDDGGYELVPAGNSVLGGKTHPHPPKVYVFYSGYKLYLNCFNLPYKLYPIV